MANYIRFDIYLPVHYSVKVYDRRARITRVKKHSLNARLITQFVRACGAQFSGITQAYPVGAPTYKGLWYDQQTGDFEVDHLTYLFALVKVHDEDAAMQFFDTWKQKLARGIHQKVILITHYPVQTSGDFF